MILDLIIETIIKTVLIKYLMKMYSIEYHLKIYPLAVISVVLLRQKHRLLK